MQGSEPCPPRQRVGLAVHHRLDQRTAAWPRDRFFLSLIAGSVPEAIVLDAEAGAARLRADVDTRELRLHEGAALSF